MVTFLENVPFLLSLRFVKILSFMISWGWIRSIGQGACFGMGRTVVQIVDSPLVVPSLDVLVPLMVEQLVDVLQFLNALSPVAEQVIDVPKIIIELIPPRTSVREPQWAEQLVEVPTVLCFLKQIVDIPVPGRGGRLAGLQVFHLEQSATAPFYEQTVDIPPFLVEVFKVFARDKVHVHHPHLLTLQLVFMRTRTSLVKAFFALFPVPKK